MTKQEFIDILDKEGVAYRIDAKGIIFVDGSYVLGSSLAYIYPNHRISWGFDTTTTAVELENLNPEDLEPMIAHYRKFHPKEEGNADTKPSGDAYVTVGKEEWEQLKAENARLKDVLERHGIKLLK